VLILGGVRRFDIRDRIAGLDPVRDHAEITRLLMFHEFAWDVRMAGRLMIWHLYANPPVAAVVGRTDALVARAEVTSLSFGDLVEYGLDSPRGREVLRFVNRSHRDTLVTAADNRFALAALAVTLVRWLDRYGWTLAMVRRRVSPVLRPLVRLVVAALLVQCPPIDAHGGHVSGARHQ
jgi:hypothetical protein